MIIQEEQQKAPIFYDQVRDLVSDKIKTMVSFALQKSKVKELARQKLKRMFDGAENQQPEPEQKKRYIEYLLNERTKQAFLQDKIQSAHKPVNDSPQEKPDLQLQLIKNLDKNKAFVTPDLLDGHYVNLDKLAMVDKSVTKDQMTSIAAAMKNWTNRLKELSFLNNGI